MRHMLLALAGFALMSGCSGRSEQRAPATNSVAHQPDLTLPDTASSKEDTSVTTLASGSEQPVSPVEQHTPQTTHTVRPKVSKARHQPRADAQPPAKAPEDTAVQAYAPAVSRDTAPAKGTDSTSSALPGDTTVAADTAKTVDSTSAAPAEARSTADTLSPQPDSARGTSDTVSSGTDTVPAPRPDSSTLAARDTTEATTTPATPAPARPGDLAARTLPVGTEIHAAIDDSITSRRDTVGQQISGHIMENVRGADGRTLLAAGTPVRFTITQIRPSRSKSSQGRLALRADAVTLGSQVQTLKADIKTVPRELRGRGVTGSEAAKVGGGAAAGAVIGGVAGKTKGAVIGGVAGAAAGAVLASQTATRDVVVKAKTPVVIVLTAPLVAP